MIISALEKIKGSGESIGSEVGENRRCCFYFYFLFLIYLAAPGLSCSMQDLSSGMWDLVPRPGIEPGLPALGTWSLSHCTITKVPQGLILVE